MTAQRPHPSQLTAVPPAGQRRHLHRQQRGRVLRAEQPLRTQRCRVQLLLPAAAADAGGPPPGPAAGRVQRPRAQRARSSRAGPPGRARRRRPNPPDHERLRNISTPRVTTADTTSPGIWSNVTCLPHTGSASRRNSTKRVAHAAERPRRPGPLPARLAPPGTPASVPAAERRRPGRGRATHPQAGETPSRPTPHPSASPAETLGPPLRPTWANRQEPGR